MRRRRSGPTGGSGADSSSPCAAWGGGPCEAWWRYNRLGFCQLPFHHPSGGPPCIFDLWQKVGRRRPRGAACGARKPATPLELQTAGELGAPGASSSTRTVARGSTPHTQGREWKMTQEEAFVGIDVSKARLDVAVLPSGEAFEGA